MCTLYRGCIRERVLVVLRGSLDSDGRSTHLHRARLTVEPVDGCAESGKMMQLLGILRKMLNVKDLSSVRISLPAQLMEPIGNLESWTYISRPDYLASVGESDDELERMLAVLRFMFTKGEPNPCRNSQELLSAALLTTDSLHRRPAVCQGQDCQAVQLDPRRALPLPLGRLTTPPQRTPRASPGRPPRPEPVARSHRQRGQGVVEQQAHAVHLGLDLDHQARVVVGFDRVQQVGQGDACGQRRQQ